MLNKRSHDTGSVHCPYCGVLSCVLLSPFSRIHNVDATCMPCSLTPRCACFRSAPTQLLNHNAHVLALTGHHRCSFLTSGHLLGRDDCPAFSIRILPLLITPRTHTFSAMIPHVFGACFDGSILWAGTPPRSSDQFRSARAALSAPSPLTFVHPVVHKQNLSSRRPPSAPCSPDQPSRPCTIHGYC